MLEIRLFCFCRFDITANVWITFADLPYYMDESLPLVTVVNDSIHCKYNDLDDERRSVSINLNSAEVTDEECLFGDYGIIQMISQDGKIYSTTTDDDVKEYDPKTGDCNTVIRIFHFFIQHTTSICSIIYLLKITLLLLSGL